MLDYDRFRDFPDGEPGGFLEDRESIYSSNVIVFSCPFDGEHREELHDIVTACKMQFGARSVVAVLSFLPFRRQDRPEKTQEITRLRWFLRDLASWGADHLVICEPHSVSNTILFCEERGLKMEIADPTPVFAVAVMDFVAEVDDDDVVVYSPGMPRLHYGKEVLPNQRQ